MVTRIRRRVLLSFLAVSVLVGLVVVLDLASIVVLVVVAPILLIGYVLSRSLTEPIERLTTMARNVAGGDFAHRVSVRRGSELWELGEALNLMAEELERRLAQVAAEQEQTDEILAMMGDGVLLLDENSRVIRANPAAARILSVNAELLEGRPLLHTARAFASLVLVGREAGASAALEEVELPGALILHVEVIPLRQSAEGGRQTLLIFRDDTARTRTDRIRRDFVANVSHELKTPLAGLGLLADTLQHAVVEDPARAQAFAGRLSAQIHRLSNLINDLLTLSRLEQTATTREPSPESVDLSRLAREVGEAMTEQASSRDLNLVVDAARSVLVVGDSIELMTALRNLLDNAMRYTDPGGHVEVAVWKEPGSGIISVRDNGMGIPRGDQSRIFERFYRVDKARSQETGGTGLGLSIVRHIVERHRGSVEVESNFGVGSTFTIRLPLVGPGGVEAEMHLG